MGHNVSDRRLRSWSLAGGEGAPPGWRRSGDRFEEVATVAGLHARGGVYAGRCQAADECSRRVKLDLAFWIAHGFGDLPLERLHHAYVCARLEGCRLQLAAAYPNGVPLMSLLQESPAIALAITCLGCGWDRAWSVERLIERLVASGQGDPNTSCNTIGARVTCPQCKTRSFETTVRRPHAQRPRLTDTVGTRV